ncbi:bifunctional SDR family oxidoreductase/polysaccharide deacetylase family protein [Aspergillus clavatus NRRL 1]|uniref:Polysaccharide deacetylase family protein n=1 Tax=Aspergillus clavatus (strain ATCC 1007 / CBS 513.65 / DSM 816 / NCTC 3887 / NRRL 1 / QM 1276 / 107) TaxID=344612 RepID=A1CNU2_ASPCL|nr:polysaccharide deacetylase family protein [Aspergillus clavatus NRRL 1]EAW07313.1 polysaccharide deacetylase family protein [Aspergillus clavatus NRRL 1]
MSREGSSSFLGLEGLHVFVTGAAGVLGQKVAQEFLEQGCKVTAHDHRSVEVPSATGDRFAHLNVQTGDISDEESVRSSIALAVKRFGPINVLIANAGVASERQDCAIWDLSLDSWEQTHRANVRGIFLAVKHFLQAARTAQQTLGTELDNLAIVIAGNEASKVGQADPTASPSDKAGLLDGLVRRVGDDIGRLNRRARINAVNLGGNDMSEDIARTMAFLASYRAAGHITGQYLNLAHQTETRPLLTAEPTVSIPRPLTRTRNKIRVTVSIDLDAVSGWLGTGHHPDNILADYSAGFFAAQVGVPRLLRLLHKLGLADRCTWFIPGHSAESFPDEVAQVIASGCEVGLHGYAHEGAYQLTVEQERDVLVRCIAIATKLTGKKPAGYRAPLYQLRESTLDLLEEFGFEYDASLTDHDCHPFFAPRRPPLKPIDFSQPASTWMHPLPRPSASTQPPDRRPLVCVPCNWYMEDMTPLQFLPHAPNSHGYTDARVIENLWRERFLWLRENEDQPIFPVLLHPDTSGMAHVVGMVERLLGWLRGWEEVEFCQTGEVARWWRKREMGEEEE